MPLPIYKPLLLHTVEPSPLDPYRQTALELYPLRVKDMNNLQEASTSQIPNILSTTSDSSVNLPLITFQGTGLILPNYKFSINPSNSLIFLQLPQQIKLLWNITSLNNLNFLLFNKNRSAATPRLQHQTGSTTFSSTSTFSLRHTSVWRKPKKLLRPAEPLRCSSYVSAHYFSSTPNP